MNPEKGPAATSSPTTSTTRKQQPQKSTEAPPAYSPAGPSAVAGPSTQGPALSAAALPSYVQALTEPGHTPVNPKGKERIKDAVNNDPVDAFKQNVGFLARPTTSIINEIQTGDPALPITKAFLSRSISNVSKNVINFDKICQEVLNLKRQEEKQGRGPRADIAAQALMSTGLLTDAHLKLFSAPKSGLSLPTRFEASYRTDQDTPYHRDTVGTLIDSYGSKETVLMMSRLPLCQKDLPKQTLNFGVKGWVTEAKCRDFSDKFTTGKPDLSFIASEKLYDRFAFGYSWSHCDEFDAGVVDAGLTYASSAGLEHGTETADPTMQARIMTSALTILSHYNRENFAAGRGFGSADDMIDEIIDGVFDLKLPAQTCSDLMRVPLYNAIKKGDDAMVLKIIEKTGHTGMITRDHWAHALDLAKFHKRSVCVDAISDCPDLVPRS